MPSFRILKSMVQSWFHEVMTKHSEFADVQLMHCYRWLNSPDSLLFEPALLRIVRATMCKVFVHLMAELRKLGSSIVFASCNKIIVATEKTNCSDAHVYMEYILGVMNKNALFRCSENSSPSRHLVLTPSENSVLTPPNYSVLITHSPRKYSMLIPPIHSPRQCNL